MTVIAYDGEYLYSDSLQIDSYGNESICNNKIKKFKRSEDYSYIAGSGLYRDVLQIYSILNQSEWFDKEYSFNCTILLLTRDNKYKLCRFDEKEIFIREDLKLPIIFGSLGILVKDKYKETNNLLLSLKEVCGVNNPINIVKV